MTAVIVHHNGIHIISEKVRKVEIPASMLTNSMENQERLWRNPVSRMMYHLEESALVVGRPDHRRL
jgi:hypothetical protein